MKKKIVTIIIILLTIAILTIVLIWDRQKPTVNCQMNGYEISEIPEDTKKIIDYYCTHDKNTENYLFLVLDSLNVTYEELQEFNSNIDEYLMAEIQISITTSYKPIKYCSVNAENIAEGLYVSSASVAECKHLDTTYIDVKRFSTDNTKLTIYYPRNLNFDDIYNEMKLSLVACYQISTIDPNYSTRQTWMFNESTNGDGNDK